MIESERAESGGTSSLECISNICSHLDQSLVGRLFSRTKLVSPATERDTQLVDMRQRLIRPRVQRLGMHPSQQQASSSSSIDKNFGVLN